MHPFFLQTAVYFTSKTAKKEKTLSLSAVPTIQVGQAVTHIDSNRTRIPALINKLWYATSQVTLSISLKAHPTKLTRPVFNLYANLQIPICTIRPLHTNTYPKTLRQKLDLVPPYSLGLPPYWSLQIPYSPSGPFYRKTLSWQILSSLHHHVPSTFQGRSQRHPSSRCTPCLQISSTCHHGGLNMENSQTCTPQKIPSSWC